jgi:hypothetical protein
LVRERELTVKLCRQDQLHGGWTTAEAFVCSPFQTEEALAYFVAASAKQMTVSATVALVTPRASDIYDVHKGMMQPALWLLHVNSG